MNQSFSTLDYVVFILYGLLIIGVGLWVSREKKGHKKEAVDYFLASKSLPWWAIGASLIASNISAEQFIGMSGSGFAVGLAISSYEWMAALTLIVVAKFMLPIFIKNGIYTMPQYLEMRFDHRVRSVMATIWLLIYVFVNLTSVVYLGALAMKTIMGVPMHYGMIGLAIFSLVYSLYGGLKAVAWTDVIQVIFLIAGGFITSYLTLQAVSGGEGIWAGLTKLYQEIPEHFDMILEPGQLMIPDGSGGTKDAYLDLPGIGVLVGGMLIANFSYWGFNQYIIQRGLAAKSITDAQNGLLFAGFLKLLIPFLVVVPGIAAFLINQNPAEYGIDPSHIIQKSDEAYPWLLHNFIPSGIKGLAFAALIAAIVSSLSSMLNSTSTIFCMDIYKKNINPAISETKLVTLGRLVAVVALIIATSVAYPLLGQLDQAFQFIQEFTGFATPGVCVIFLAGLFWKRATPTAALATSLLPPCLMVIKGNNGRSIPRSYGLCLFNFSLGNDCH